MALKKNTLIAGKSREELFSGVCLKQTRRESDAGKWGPVRRHRIRESDDE